VLPAPSLFVRPTECRSLLHLAVRRGTRTQRRYLMCAWMRLRRGGNNDRRNIWSSGYQCRAGRQTMSKPCTRIAKLKKENVRWTCSKPLIVADMEMCTSCQIWQGSGVMSWCIKDWIGRSNTICLVILKQSSDCRPCVWSTSWPASPSSSAGAPERISHLACSSCSQDPRTQHTMLRCNGRKEKR